MGGGERRRDRVGGGKGRRKRGRTGEGARGREKNIRNRCLSRRIFGFVIFSLSSLILFRIICFSSLLNIFLLVMAFSVVVKIMLYISCSRLVQSSYFLFIWCTYSFVANVVLYGTLSNPLISPGS